MATLTFSQAELNLIAIGMQIAGERFERDAANEHMPERLREQFERQAEIAYSIVQRIEGEG